MASGRDTPILDRYRDEERLPRVYPLVLDGVYRMAGSVPVFQEARAPTVEELHALLAKIIARLMRLLTRQGVLIEEQGMSYLAGIEADQALTPLQAASCTYRIALGPRAGQKVLSLQTVSGRREPAAPPLRQCAWLACTRRCAVRPISATSSNSCADTSPAQRLPTDDSVATAPVMSCCD